MATLNQARAVAQKLSATLIDDCSGNHHECRVEAPRGHRWKCDEVHELVDSVFRPWKPDYDDLISRMNYGTEVCLDPDCEWCNPETKS